MAGKEVLVPLTSSLYVPGRLADTEMVVVDIGTGYYVRKVNTTAVPSRRESGGGK